MQKNNIEKDTKAIKTEARSEEIENINNYAISGPTQEDIKSVKNMLSWVKIFCMFKKKGQRDSGQQDTKPVSHESSEKLRK